MFPMVWYNIKEWFTGEHSDITLYCGNTQCKKLISDKEVAFNEEYSEIYHPNELCPQIAAARRAFASGAFVYTSIEYIRRETALRLLDAGKLAQSKRLEDKL